MTDLPFDVTEAQQRFEDACRQHGLKGTTYVYDLNARADVAKPIPCALLFEIKDAANELLLGRIPSLREKRCMFSVDPHSGWINLGLHSYEINGDSVLPDPFGRSDRGVISPGIDTMLKNIVQDALTEVRSRYRADSQ